MPSPDADRCDSSSAVSPPSDSVDLEEFYLEYFLPLVRRAIRRYGLSAEDSHDIVQEAFLLGIVKLDLSKNPRAWLYQVVDHLASNLRRKTARRARLIATWSGSSKPIRNPAGAIDDF